MKPIIRNTVIASLALAAVSGQALSSTDTPLGNAADAKSFQSAVEALRSAGYTQIREVEFEDGLYEAKVYDKEGSRLKVLVDPVTGALKVTKKKSLRWFSSKSDDRASDKAVFAANAMPIDKVWDIIESQGYKAIHSVELEKGYYEAKVIDETGRSLKLMIDPVKGSVWPDRKAGKSK